MDSNAPCLARTPHSSAAANARPPRAARRSRGARGGRALAAAELTGKLSSNSRANKDIILNMKYSEKRKAEIIGKMAGPDRLSIAELAKREKISTATLYNWRKEARAQGRLLPDADDSPAGWSAADKFNAVLQAASLSEVQTAEFCRANAILPEQLERWGTACRQANDWDRSQSERLQKSRRADQARIRELEADLTRKDKALAETTAILVLRKKLQGILEGEDV